MKRGWGNEGEKEEQKEEETEVGKRGGKQTRRRKTRRRKMRRKEKSGTEAEGGEADGRTGGHGDRNGESMLRFSINGAHPAALASPPSLAPSCAATPRTPLPISWFALASSSFSMVPFSNMHSTLTYKRLFF